MDPITLLILAPLVGLGIGKIIRSSKEASSYTSRSGDHDDYGEGTYMRGRPSHYDDWKREPVASDD
jgi:hypothetical protein